MRRFLLGLFLALVLVGAVVADSRVPPMYNAQTATVTLTANFFAGGGSSSALSNRILWRQANGTAGKTFVLTPASNGRTCTVTLVGGGTGQVDINCDYANADGSHATTTVTICWAEAAVDQINLSATG